MYCGGCFRDNALVAALRQLGHSTLMVPLYLPLTLDEPDQSAGTPIFFSGVNVYLEQKLPLFRHAPGWLHRWLASPRLLNWAGRFAGRTRAADVGDLALSMIRGEDGHQARELAELTAWLKTQPRTDVISLSNVLLAGMARRLKAELRAPVVCTLQGEDTFLDALPKSVRAQAWETLVERARDIDLFIAPSRYFADLMRERLQIPADRMKVVFNGINLDGYETVEGVQNPPVLGYFARMCPEKGLDMLVAAYLLLKQRPGTANLKLHIGGGRGPSDENFLGMIGQMLKDAGVYADVAFFPNVNREEKLAFLRGLTVFSAPALYGEAFGLYVIEALAAGVPVVQPRHAAFPELIEATGGGLLVEPGDAKALADGIENLVLHPRDARFLGKRGQEAVREKFTAERMARDVAQVFGELAGRPAPTA